MVKPKIPPAVAGMMGADGGGWNLIKRPKDPEHVEKAKEVIQHLLASKDPEDKKALKSLTTMRNTAAEERARLMTYMVGISTYPAFMQTYAEWAFENPGEHMKIMNSLFPKEANLAIKKTEERIIRLEYPGEKKWLEMVDGHEIIDVDEE